MTDTAMTDTETTPEPAPAAAPAATAAPGAVYNVGETPEGDRILAATPDSVWDKPDTPVWIEGADPAADTVPWSKMNEAYGGKLIIDAEPTPMPKPGEIRDQVMRDLGWDDETTRKMAESRNRVDPARYPTVEDAMPPNAAAPAPPDDIPMAPPTPEATPEATPPAPAAAAAP